MRFFSRMLLARPHKEADYCCNYDMGIPLYRSVQCPVHKKEHDWHKHSDMACPECGLKMISTVNLENKKTSAVDDISRRPYVSP